MSHWPHAPIHYHDGIGAYIVTAATYKKRHHFRDHDRLAYLHDQLLKLAEQYRWQMQAWAVFSNHYHFVAVKAEDSAALAEFVRALHSIAAEEVNRLDGQQGRVVWYQYWDTQLTYEKSYLARLNYVHQNAVKHGLVAVARDYPWCSAGWFEQRASRAFFRSVSSFKIDRVNVPDAFEVEWLGTAPEKDLAFVKRQGQSGSELPHSKAAAPHFVTHLESALDGTCFDPSQVHTVHQGRPLWVRYDLEAIRKNFSREAFLTRPPSLWRYRELLPLPADVEPVTLGEGMSPLLPCPRLGRELGVPNLWIKDESQLPTGSFKSRGMTAAVSMAKHFGLRRLAVPTAGNAGGALAVYGARAGMEVFVFMPEDTPRINQLEAKLAGAKVFLVNGLITDCGKIIREGVDKAGWFDMSTLKEPYRLEGKKTMGLELAEQMDWRLPDVILYPTGGGTGLIGMWKAFQELEELGWLDDERFPRMIACQSDGCAPIVRAFETNQRFAEPFPNAHTIASGLRVPAAVGDFMMLDVIRESGGLAIAGREKRIGEWMQRVTAAEGIAVCPETAVCFDCLEQLGKLGRVGEHETVLVFNTGAAQKYPETVPLDLPRLERDARVDYAAIVAS